MATVKILDHYRLPIINDKKAFFVLSTIYKSDAEDEANIQARTNIPAKELRAIVTKLFRANLIREGADERWSVTPLAEEMLDSLGISEIVANSLVLEEDLTKNDRTFLSACVAGGPQRNHSWLRDISAVLRASKVAFKIAAESESIDQDEKARTLYALIIGTNPSAKGVGIETYCDSVSRWYSTDHPEVASLFWSKGGGLNDWISNKCISGLSDFRSSNRLLLTGDTTADKSIYLITLSRVIANLVAQRDTSDLGLVYSLDKDIFSKGLDSLKRSRPSLGRNASKYFRWLVEPNSESDNFDGFRKELIQRLTRSAERTSGASGRFQTLECSIRSVYAYSKSVTSVTALYSDIIKGNLDSLSSDEKLEIIAVLSSATDAARLRFTPGNG